MDLIPKVIVDLLGRKSVSFVLRLLLLLLLSLLLISNSLKLVYIHIVCQNNSCQLFTILQKLNNKDKT